MSGCLINTANLTAKPGQACTQAWRHRARMAAAPNAGSACVVNRVDGRRRRHYGWLAVGPLEASLCMVSETLKGPG
jgi:hypothetical protein